MSEWGTRIDVPILDNRIEIENLEDIQQYEFNCKEKKCLNYMYNNGKTIYDETDKFINLSDNVLSTKIKMLFNTDNMIKNRLLNDNILDEIQEEVHNGIIIEKNISKNYIINHILYIVKPYLLNNTDIDFETIKQDIINTIIFKINYMTDIKTQLKFLFDDNTILFIKGRPKSWCNHDAVKVSYKYGKLKLTIVRKYTKNLEK